MTKAECDVTIIGAGAVGLAVAAEVSRIPNLSTFVIEAAESFGSGTSSRNSEVIHAGIYYPENSLKARLCIEGAELLYRFCESHQVPFRKAGKFIVARTDKELPSLQQLFTLATSNGARNLKILEGGEVRKVEPAILARAAILSPETGIIDSHTYMKSLERVAESNGTTFLYRNRVTSIEKTNDGRFEIGIEKQDVKIISKMIINSAGLFAEKIAAIAGFDVEALNYKLKFCKGSYFRYNNPSPVKCLVYPLPNRHLAGLGIHATLDLSGALRFGPDVEFLDNVEPAALDYRVESGKAKTFFNSARSLIDGLDEERFVPDFAGVRPKVVGLQRDFIIQHEVGNGHPGFVNLIGIESPGLTASLAIATQVARWVRDVVI